MLLGPRSLCSEVWTGIVHKRRKVRALKVSWAYAPGLVRVRSTADGRHWETALASAPPPGHGSQRRHVAELCGGGGAEPHRHRAAVANGRVELRRCGPAKCRWPLADLISRADALLSGLRQR